ncbi:ABC transporter ATP-binding protein [Herbiconiux moechotypicola]|uniref:ABC transporter ATP-binding protein n=1 Tax=Herbiconiux moechotypicola TaxID=637393 RepID=A0ABN3DFC7_9MICO|nr:ABC transporter ATP-binding protein [Herbiconiux moechotypicola]MCS5729378.1 ABC transporter ATP-binding protein [Herbiconiux moechotypicola]
MTGTERLRAENVVLGYGDAPIVDGLSIEVPDGSFTVIVGANGSGKSTLLRGLARLLRPSQGEVVLDERPLRAYGSKELARLLGLLPQSQAAPESIGVADLVARGRYPHQTLLRQWSPSDAAAVERALERTGTAELADRTFDELSGGQRQRVWVAMALAQETSILLLDEPTTFLDIAHQVDLLDLCSQLQQENGYTMVLVLHDLNLATRYATHLVAMKDGSIVAQGEPSAIITPALVEEVFGLPCTVIPDPETGTPLVIPRRSPHMPPNPLPEQQGESQ